MTFRRCCGPQRGGRPPDGGPGASADAEPVGWVLTVLILLPFAWRLQPVSRITQRWRYQWAVVLGVGAYNSLQYLALVTATPLNVTLVASSLPVWMLAVGAVGFGVQPTRRQLLGAALALVGVALVIGRGPLQTVAQVHFVAGDLLMLRAIFSWAIYSWLLVRPPPSMRGDQRPDWNWAGFLLIQALFGVAAAGVFTAGDTSRAPTGALELGRGRGAGLCVGGRLIGAYRCWGLGVAAAGPALPPSSQPHALVRGRAVGPLLGEGPHPYHAAAFALIVGGIAVSAHTGR